MSKDSVKGTDLKVSLAILYAPRDLNCCEVFFYVLLFNLFRYELLTVFSHPIGD